MAASTRTTIEGRELSVSNLEKVLFPHSGFTKGQLIDYYVRVAPVMLPHIRERPLTMKRFPDGVESKFFFEKHIPSHAPEWVRSVDVPANDGQDVIPYAMVNDVPTLAWAANLGTIELHVPLWHVGRHRKLPAPPDLMVFDLDPGEGTSIVECCVVAGYVMDELARQGPSRSPRRAGRRACSSTPPSGRRRPGTACGTAVTRSPASWSPSTRTSSSPTCASRCARAGSSSTGARTTRPRRRSPSTRSGPCRRRRCRPLSARPRCGAAPRSEDPAAPSLRDR